MRYIISAMMLVFLGCSALPKNEFIEGTSLTIGLYIPYNGSIYGIQALNYLSGKRIIITQTNEFPKVESSHIITNSTFGVFDTVDMSKTSINN